METDDGLRMAGVSWVDDKNSLGHAHLTRCDGEAGQLGYDSATNGSRHAQRHDPGPPQTMTPRGLLITLRDRPRCQGLPSS
ncbi:MAG: hypothetical protein ABI268_06830 [Rhodanobacter sp.]